MVYTGCGRKRRIVETARTFYYVPILKTLENILSDDHMREVLVFNNEYSNDCFIRSFNNGSLCKIHPVFSLNLQALQIVLYHDEVQICNAVGNHVKKHKLYMFYFFLLNLPPKYRTKLEDIKLVAIARSVDVKEYGFNAILKPLLQDMKMLSSPDGYTFILENERCITLQGALAAYIADTPASHEAAGFKEGVGGSFKKCRHCHATFETMQTCFCEDEFNLRNLIEHLAYLEEMSQQSALSQHFGITYGINRASILLEFPHFDICEQMPEDIMHVLLERVIPRTMKLILHNFITVRKLLTLKELNSRIAGFNYVYFNKKYQPNPITKDDVNINNGDYKFKQDADQMWLLSSILPFLLDDYVDGDDNYWNLFQILMDITRISFTCVLSIETIARLKELIVDFLSLFKALFVNENITPKMHYLVHFPRMLLSLGPLKHFWCMRMESKHGYFKSLHNVTGYKNLPLSLAKRHQKLAAVQMIDNKKSSNQVGKSQQLTGEQLNRVIDRLQRQYHIDTDHIHSIYICTWAVVDSIKYVPKECALFTGYNEMENPLFSKIDSIIFVNSPEDIFFQCQDLDTVHFEDKLCAYQVEVPLMASGLSLLTKDKLKLHEPLQLINHKCSTFVLCRYNLDDYV